MTGREHWEAAEQLLAAAEYRHWDDDSMQIHFEEEDCQARLAAAQVHATLALAAATIGGLYHGRTMSLPSVAKDWFV